MDGSMDLNYFVSRKSSICHMAPTEINGNTINIKYSPEESD